MEIIESTQNKKIKLATKLHQKKYRDKEGLFLAEGKHLVEEAMKNNLIVEIFTSDPKINGTLVTTKIIKKISTSVSPQPIVAICKIPNVKIKGKKLLYLDNVQDPGNVGTLIRSAKAFNWDGVIVKGADIYNPKVIRASQGAIFSIPTININNENMINEFNLKKVGAILDENAKNYKKLNISEMLLIIGNEGNGISENIKKMLDYSIYIPINYESLNAAIAGSILLNEYQ